MNVQAALHLIIQLFIWKQFAYAYVAKLDLRYTLDPEINMDAGEILQRWGYEYEEHNAVTDDGYVLGMIRIFPKPVDGRNETPVVFLQHGLESSCVDWINNLPGQSAGFYFADAGFDVWLGNFRGTKYSRNHTTLTPEDNAFWQFTWDQMAAYDLPAMVEKTLNVTGKSQLYYVGHSEGTLSAFAKMSTDAHFANKIKVFFALAPVFTLKHIQGPFKYMSKLTYYQQLFSLLFGGNQFLPSKTTMNLMARYFCPHHVTKEICSSIMFLICGTDSYQMNATRIPVYLAHNPSGTSTRNVIHFGQMVNTGECRMYDYGSECENKKHYNGRVKPPSYEISSLTVPTVIFYSTTDILATEKDVQDSILKKVPNIKQVYKFANFNHLDFIWGLRAAYEIYRPIQRYILKEEAK